MKTGSWRERRGKGGDGGRGGRWSGPHSPPLRKQAALAGGQLSCSLRILLQRYSANDRMSLRVGLRPAHVLHQRGQREPVPHYRPALPGHAAEGAARGGLPPAGQRRSHGRTDTPPFPNQTLLITKPLWSVRTCQWAKPSATDRP